MKPIVQILGVLFVIALYAFADSGPSETDALQVSAEIFNDIAAENAAQRALVAIKD